MKKKKRNKITKFLLGTALLVGTAVATYYYIKNKKANENPYKDVKCNVKKIYLFSDSKVEVPSSPTASNGKQASKLPQKNPVMDGITYTSEISDFDSDPRKKIACQMANKVMGHKVNEIELIEINVLPTSFK